MPALRFSSSGVREVTADMDKINQKSREQLEAIKDNQRASQEFDRIVRGINRRNETEQGRYNRLLAEAKTALDSNKISARAYEREVANINEEIETSSKRFRQFREDQEEAFDDSALTQFVVGMGTAILTGQGIKQVLQDIQAERERILAFSEGGERSLSSLSQVATSQEDFSSLVGQARDFFQSGAAESISQAAGSIFSLTSAGAGAEIDIFKQLAKSGTAQDTSLLVRAAQTLRASFGEEAGTFEDVIDRAFAASRFAPAIAESLTEAAARGAGSAKALGFSPDALFAATALASEAAGTAERGGTQVASLLRSFEDPKVEALLGDTFEQTISNIAAKQLSGGELTDLFGRAEAVQGFRTLSGNFERFREATAAAQSANVENLTRQQIQFSESDPSVAAIQVRREELNRRDITLEQQNKGIRQAAIEADRARIDRELAENLGPGFLADAYRSFLRGADVAATAVGLNSGDAALRNLGIKGFESIEPTQKETNRILQELLDLQKQQPDLTVRIEGVSE